MDFIAAVEQNSTDADVNITDEEKEKMKITDISSQSNQSNRPFLDIVLAAMDCTENDYLALLALCLIYTLSNNEGKTKRKNNSIEVNE